MDIIKITSTYGYINLPFMYIGWNTIQKPTVNETDCGDELFGFCLFNFYVGYYEDQKWCCGFLDETGCLN